MATQSEASASPASVPARAKAVTAGADPATVTVSLTLAAAMRAQGVSHAALARAVRVSRELVTRWCNPLQAAVYNARHEELCRQRLPRLYDELTRRRSPAGRPADCLQRALLVAVREQGQLSASVLEALADGQFTPAEARIVAREAAELVAAVEAIRLRAEAAG